MGFVPDVGSVSVPYEITLLSNMFCSVDKLIIVSVPYEITLLSNMKLFMTNPL